MTQGTIDQERFKQVFFALLDETFETHHGMFLNKGTSFLDTLESITADQASQPKGGGTASIAAQVAHTTFYLQVLERYMRGAVVGDVDWGEIWRTVGEVSPDEWVKLKQDFEIAYRRITAAMRSIQSWDDDKALGGTLAVVVHTAYHLGGVRQALALGRSQASAGERNPAVPVGQPSTAGRGMSQRVVPQLRMTSWQRTRPFYENGLGFKVDWEHRFEPGFPVFAQVTRDGLTLFLTEHEGDCQAGGAAYLVVDDVDALYQEFCGRQVQVEGPPQTMEWNARELTLADPDGNRLRFSSRVA